MKDCSAPGCEASAAAFSHRLIDGLSVAIRTPGRDVPQYTRDAQPACVRLAQASRLRRCPLETEDYGTFVLESSETPTGRRDDGGRREVGFANGHGEAITLGSERVGCLADVRYKLSEPTGKSAFS